MARGVSNGYPGTSRATGPGVDWEIMVLHRSLPMPRTPFAVRLLAGLLVLALLVAAQNLHAPMAHAADAPPAAALSDSDHGDGHDHDHHQGGDTASVVDQPGPGSDSCAGSICALCLALVPAVDLDPHRTEAVVTATPILASPDAPVERLYRPPILPV